MIRVQLGSRRWEKPRANVRAELLRRGRKAATARRMRCCVFHPPQPTKTLDCVLLCRGFIHARPGNSGWDAVLFFVCRTISVSPTLLAMRSRALLTIAAFLKTLFEGVR